MKNIKKSLATGWPSGAPTAPQFREFLSQIESRKITKESFQLFLRGGSHFKDRARIRNIMGDDIIFPDEVSLACNIHYSDEVLLKLSRSMPKTRILQELKKKGFALVPGPPEPMSLEQIAEALPYMVHEQDVQLLKERENIADIQIKSQWYAIKKKGVRRKPKNKNIPLPGVFVWLVGIFLYVRGERIFEDEFLRFDHSIGIGSNTANGLDIGTKLSEVYSLRWPFSYDLDD